MPEINVATKAAMLALYAECDYSALRLTQLFDVSQTSVRRIIKEARERGFNPTRRPLRIEDKYLEPKPRTGGTKKNPTTYP
ncbi:hypothetical protein E5D57_012095 [Metarhizium anisopliae]|nr:hypothetical protein E5D57_012095 [Metarhizium anisopliae]